jgi:hypothetical protein
VPRRCIFLSRRQYLWAALFRAMGLLPAERGGAVWRRSTLLSLWNEVRRRRGRLLPVEECSGGVIRIDSLLRSEISNSVNSFPLHLLLHPSKSIT